MTKSTKAIIWTAAIATGIAIIAYIIYRMRKAKADAGTKGTSAPVVSNTTPTPVVVTPTPTPVVSPAAPIPVISPVVTSPTVSMTVPIAPPTVNMGSFVPVISPMPMPAAPIATGFPMSSSLKIASTGGGIIVNAQDTSAILEDGTLLQARDSNF